MSTQKELQEVKMAMFRDFKSPDGARPDDIMEAASQYVDFCEYMVPLLDSCAEEHGGGEAIPGMALALVEQGCTVFKQNGRCEDKVAFANGLIAVKAVAMIAFSMLKGEAGDAMRQPTLEGFEAFKVAMEEMEGGPAADAALDLVNAYVKGEQGEGNNSMLFSGVASGCISIGLTAMARLFTDGSQAGDLLEEAADNLRKALGQ